jgi:hypothetical protein
MRELSRNMLTNIYSLLEHVTLQGNLELRAV